MAARRLTVEQRAKLFKALSDPRGTRGAEEASRSRMRTLCALLGSLLVLLLPLRAQAFCGFYVGGDGSPLVNNATQVVIMRDGLRTVISMQNNYQGPPARFAMVVPVPVVLQQENVKTLSRAVFDRVDKLDSPRLVEYWEQDPCAMSRSVETSQQVQGVAVSTTTSRDEGRQKDLGVKVEARFSVGEYDILILSAKDSGGLETWLHQERYQIPVGAETFLRPYVQRGSKFFVAKVDPKRVTFANGMATLSPIRFHYDSEELSLPIRLGLVNASGPQDLLVHILAKERRYEVANYPNVAIPTNLEVTEETRTQFPAFYAAVFDRVLARNPRAVVTEYSWGAGSCDPCPTPPLDLEALAQLGADVSPSIDDGMDPLAFASKLVLTRLHARYTRENLGADLVFRSAKGIVGGRELMIPSIDDQQQLEHGALPSTFNRFQARYVIRHAWTGAVECERPRRHRWGGPPGAGIAIGGSSSPLAVAQDLAFAPRGQIELSSFLRDPTPDLDVVAQPAVAGDPPLGVAVPPAVRACGCSLTPSNGAVSLGALLLPVGALLARRRARR